MNAAGIKATVLVVEDEPALRSIAVIALDRAGFRVLEAESGAAAMHFWSKHQGDINVLITDITLGGGMNGDAIAKECRKTNPSLPVIFASGNLREANEKDFDLCDHRHYLSKPYSPQTLVDAVRECLRELPKLSTDAEVSAEEKERPFDQRQS